jgi:hypothetical protein
MGRTMLLQYSPYKMPSSAVDITAALSIGMPPMTKMLLWDERGSGERRQSYVHRYIELAHSIMSVMTPILPAALLGAVTRT